MIMEKADFILSPNHFWGEICDNNFDLKISETRRHDKQFNEKIIISEIFQEFRFLRWESSSIHFSVEKQIEKTKIGKKCFSPRWKCFEIGFCLFGKKSNQMLLKKNLHFDADDYIRKLLMTLEALKIAKFFFLIRFFEKILKPIVRVCTQSIFEKHF